MTSQGSSVTRSNDELARVAGALAIAAIMLIAIKSSTFRLLLHPLAAVGQTSLSNYLLGV